MPGRPRVTRARAIEGAVSDLETTFDVPAWECDVSLRSLMLHLIRDYARHNGHADLIGEAIDGQMGA